MAHRYCMLLLASLFSCTAFSQRTVDILHYRYELTLNDLTDSVYGKATINVRFLQAADSVSFDFTQEKNNQRVMVADTYLANEQQTAITSKSQPEKLTLYLQQPVHAGDTLAFIITYKGIPADGLIISKNKYGHRTFFADNWPNRGHHWLPCVDDPGDKASVEFIITAPLHYQVVANGIQVEETNLNTQQKRTHWREDVPIATKVMVIGVADFAVQLSGTVANCIPVYSWVYPENRQDGFYDYAQAAAILPFFIDYAGPYGYKKLANVQSKTTFGGLENANTIFYYENSVTGTRKSEALIAHEIAHQWFGNMVTEKSFAHLWLSEGFATYMTTLYMESRYGNDTAVAMRKEDRDQVIAFASQSDKAVIDHSSDYMQLLNENSYQKGGWVLHMLRHQLGDSLFKKSIRAFYARYAGGNADTDDFRKMVEKESGKHLEGFFKQWLYTPGVPQLRIQWKYDAASKKVNIRIVQMQPSLYQFPLEIAIAGNKNQLITHRLDITKKEQSFTLASPEKPLKLIADPGTHLLFSFEIAAE